MARFCGSCGRPAPDGARFCAGCGAALREAAAQRAPGPDPSARERSPAGVQPRETAEVRPPLEARQAAASGPLSAASTPDGLAAAAAAGEFFCGAFQLEQEGSAPAAGPAASGVRSPAGGLLDGALSLVRGVAAVVRRPAALVGALVLAVLWFVLGSLRNSDSPVVKVLCWLTFAEGGLDRSVPGALGGVLGKGTVAAALVSLFNGGLKRAGKGVAAVFKGHGEKRSLVSLGIGLLVGAGLYFVFTGPGASLRSTMAGLSGTLLSLEALSGDGGLYSLAEALTGKAQNGVRTAVRSRCDGLLTGLAAGFALTAALLALI